MQRLSSMLAKTLASAVVTTAALSGCSMMCGACTGRSCSAQTAQQKAACKAKCGACGGKK